MTNKDDAALLSVPSAAKRLGVSEEWVRKAARDRRIRSVKIGSRLLFRPETIDDFIDANTREPVQA